MGGSVMTEDVNLRLSPDEALVFFDWISRFNAEKGYVFEDQAEQRVLWDLEAMLEKVLVEPFRLDHEALLFAARARVRDETE